MLETLYQQVIEGIYHEAKDPPAFVEHKQTLSAAEQLGIYRDSVHGNLVIALGDIFPAVKEALGATFFDAMASRYVAQHPSRSPRLDDYGEHFPAFVASFEPLADYPYMRDVAQLDWHWHRLFHMSSPTVVAFDSLATLAPAQIESMQLGLIPALVWIDSAYPLEKIWRLSRFPEQAASTDSIDLNEGASTVVVYRFGLDTLVTSIDPLCRDLLIAIKKRKSFGTICEELGSKCGPEQINQALATLVQHHWISELIVDTESSGNA